MKNIQAFPSTEFSEGSYNRGMTLRDYFAGQVLAGFMSQHSLASTLEDDSDYCYKVADAMLKARDK